jgi:tRNA(Arg) A34 adenosine deaminase TadA
MDNETAMTIALDEARAALIHGDVPIGAVVLHEGRIIAQRHNERELTQDPTAHAEILALQDASEELGTWRLSGCTLVVTLEPCIMCAGAMVNSRLDRVVFGAPDLKAGATGSLYNVLVDPRLNHNADVVHGVLEAECQQLMSDFFAQLRP